MAEDKSINAYARARNKLAHKAYYERHKNDPTFKAKQKANHDRWIEKNRDRWNAYLKAYNLRKALAERRADNEQREAE